MQAVQRIGAAEEIRLSVPKDTRRINARATKRAVAAEAKRRAAAAKAIAEEERAEKLAPRVQREPVLGRNGEVLRGPRLDIQNNVPSRANPVTRLRRSSERKDSPTITKAHEDASNRLIAAWEEGAEGISAGVGGYGERTGGSPQTGIIAEAVLSAVNRQIMARQEVGMVKAHLGALWPVIHAVVVLGIDPTTWGEAQDMRSEIATGYLAAALDRLVELYRPKEDRPQRIRAAEVTGFAVEEIEVAQ